ncbi:Uncharacterised protein [Legionella steigerwaltii]|uniref:Uncharacterized protein n=1 Tax=Legionella steigerwaltii TaxID=460 RepID=A0A378LAT8_9GAMM|nr:hypothetical protein [Legionella steigerwaltii]KTD77722.1 hypothetical protein Lstg_2079 [Legionella steigerwaltii]STY23032.1 Uncharacterised protein [Legionella steigerwaltii]
MTVPKTSGFLNNCGVNGGLHIINGIFKKLARNPDTDEIPIQVKTQYQELLNLFALRYKISASYSSLVKYLDSLKNNTAQQIIMGPVLRDYMKKNGAAEDLTSIQDDGRYKMLTVKQVSDYAYGPLGISIEATEPDKAPETLVSDHEIAKIHYHLENHHFQSHTPDVGMEQIIIDHEQLHQTNPDLYTAANLMGADKETSETGLDGICEVVKNGFNTLNNLVSEHALNYAETMAGFKKLYEDYRSNLGFFASNVEQVEQTKEYAFEEEVEFATPEAQEAYDEKLAIQLQKKEFDKVQDPKVFDVEQIQSDEELARLLQEEENSKFSM